MNERRQEIYFVLMSIFTLIAIGVGFYMYIYYWKYPMFIDPSSIPEHFAQPIFISMLTIVLILLLGTFITHFITMIPFKKLKLFKMEMEFESNTIREQQIANQFLYTSTMLHNHTENVKYLFDNNLFDLKEVLQFLTESYKTYSLFYNNEMTLEIDVLDSTELRGKERKLFNAIDAQKNIKTNTNYVNRLIRGENLLIGTATVGEGSGKVVTIIRRGYDNPFDTYDQETLESILAYAVIVFDTIVMIQLFQENSIFDGVKGGKSQD